MSISIEKCNQIKEVINNSKKILIATHVDPDGDAIGSSLGLYNSLELLNKNVDIIIKKASKDFDFLTNFNKIKTDESELDNNYDTLFVLDCSDKNRVALDFEQFEFNNVIVIDHHATHMEFGDITLLDSNSCATCEIVFDFVNSLNIDINKKIAECLYSGIVTDSGCFKYASVTPHTFEVAKILLEKDLNISYITRRVNDVMTINKFNLLKICLNNIEIIDKNIAFTYLSKNDIQLVGNNEDNIHEGLVNYGRDIEDIEVSIFVRQTDDNEYKVSMRSNEYVNVSEIAQKLGGGGHIKAAGIKYKGKIEELKEILINEAKKQI